MQGVAVFVFLGALACVLAQTTESNGLRLLQCSYDDDYLYEVHPDHFVGAEARRMTTLEPQSGSTERLGRMTFASNSAQLGSISTCLGIAWDSSTGATYVVLSTGGLERRLHTGRKLQSGTRWLGTLDTTTLTVSVLSVMPDNIAGLVYNSGDGRLWAISGNSNSEFMPSTTLFWMDVSGAMLDTADVSLYSYCSLTSSGGVGLSYVYGDLLAFTSKDGLVSVTQPDSGSAYIGSCDVKYISAAGTSWSSLGPQKLSIVESRNGYESGAVETQDLAAAWGSSRFSQYYAFREGQDSSGIEFGEEQQIRRAQEVPTTMAVSYISIASGSVVSGAMVWVGEAAECDNLAAVFWHDGLGAPLTSIRCPACEFATFIEGVPYYYPPNYREAYARQTDDCQPLSSSSSSSSSGFVLG